MLKSKILFGIIVTLLCVSFSNQVFAGDDDIEDSYEYQLGESLGDQGISSKTKINPVTSKPFDVTMIDTGGPRSLKDLAFKIMKFLNLTIAGVSLIGVMGGGIILIVSAGSEGLMQKGKDILKYSIIGLVVTLSAYLIVTLVQTILGTLDK